MPIPSWRKPPGWTCRIRGSLKWMPNTGSGDFSESSGLTVGTGAKSTCTPFMESEGFQTTGRAGVCSREPREVVPGVWMTGEIPRTTPFENTGGSFFLDKKLQNPAPLLDDQSLFLKTGAGLIVVLGCARSGVINALRYIQELTHEPRIHTIVGGLHLESASPRGMNETVAARKSIALERLGFCHCTGLAATVRLWNEFPGRCFQAHAGLHLEIEP